MLEQLTVDMGGVKYTACHICSLFAHVQYTAEAFTSVKS